MRTVTSSARSAPRTSLSVQRADDCHREILNGERFAWSFRPHYHAGDEVVHLDEGRALLRIGKKSQIVEAGETVVVPAGVVHRFEPLDAMGWGFRSHFVMHTHTNSAATDLRCNTLMARVRMLLADRHSLRTDIAQIADACAMSKGYLARRFRREAGTSLHDFHVLIAVHQAKALLKDGLSIVDSALGAGFYDQAHLTRELVRTYGFTPGNFRNAWLSAPPLNTVTMHQACTVA